jgi:hypothetical protein
VQPGTLLNEETTVTFRVDMRGRADSGSFDPSVDVVAVNGSFLPGGWQPWDSLITQAFDDGVTGGDTTAGDLIYTVQVALPRGTNSRLAYKYGINGQDNEAAVGSDRIRYVRATGTYELPLDVFGTITEENATLEIGPVAINRTGAQVTVTWPAGTGVRLERINNITTGAATEVTGTDGQGSYTVETTGEMGIFRAVKP